MPKALASFFFIALLFLRLAPLAAQPYRDDPVVELLDEVRSLKERLERIESNQKEILDREEKILADLDRIRVQIRRT